MVPARNPKNGKKLNVGFSWHVVKILRTRRVQDEGPYVLLARRRADHMMGPKIGWLRICERTGLKNLHVHDFAAARHLSRLTQARRWK